MIAQRCGVMLDREMNTAAPRSELCAESKEAQEGKTTASGCKDTRKSTNPSQKYTIFFLTHTMLKLEPRRPPREQHTKVVPVRRLRDQMRHLALDAQGIMSSITITLELLLHPK